MYKDYMDLPIMEVTLYNGEKGYVWDFTQLEYRMDACRHARTLSPDYLGRHGRWQVKAEVITDYYSWVNHFDARRDDGQWVFGDFQWLVTASSKEALEDFLSHFPYREWDYWDI